MRNQWTNFYTGSVELKVTGTGIERFVNDLVRREIYLWDMKRLEDGSISFNMNIAHVHRMRRVLRRHPCKVAFMKRTGLPFLMRRLLFNSGFLVGFILFLVALFLLSNVIWNIEISGAKPETEHLIRKELAKIGVQKGKFQFTVDGSDEIQRKLSHEIGAITWVGVELKGTTYHLQVVEKKEPKRPVAKDRQNLVAAKKAIVRQVIVDKGKAIVSVNDFVKKGQLLVSANINTNQNTAKSEVLVPAEGKVMGEVWYISSVEIPLKTHFSVFTGKEYNKRALTFGKFAVPVWGFKKPDYREYVREESDKPLFFLGWKLPVAYKTITYRDKKNVVREYSKKEAIQKGKLTALKDLKKELPKNSSVIGQKVLHEGIENGTVILSIHYQVLENIAIERPIIQGD
ncbi:sporulation protein YqfD [Bacillus testis]|uniref:sporulation protein YqfD n=1 Tax=Bacillus testis TaxID=1622072 RepID=UPI00067EFE4B|nr:sporulation protein YqfD [Bacillus testis]